MKKEIINVDYIRHSLAHVLAMAVLKKFPKAKLGIGPVIENGFYYDFDLPRALSDKDLPELENIMRELIIQKLQFKEEKVAPAKARKIFKDQPFKLDLIKDFVKEKKQLTAYHTSDFVDLCRGGHVKITSEINPDAFKLTKIASAYWQGNEKKPQLTRIYGIAFTTKKEVEEYLKLQEEIEKRDHRVLGERLDLFSQQGIAPGAIFWHPKGMILWRALEQFMRKKLDAAGYGEVSTPVMIKKEVFVRSGHWEHYRENLFTFEVGKETYVLKPMNCPESTYIYSSYIRSYRDLPLRFSEITDRLHRNERSGTLGGLFRVRQFTQDDAHIYCAPEQIEGEINNLLALVKEVYQTFDLPISYKLATKPDNAMGSLALWEKAESALESILKKSGKPYEIFPKDAVFYGPKIDIYAKDVLRRSWQVATIQLDFQLAENFDLHYNDADGKKKRPVVIHRAIFGTFERFIGILIEHYAGAFPFWLAPVQVAILAMNEKVRPHAVEVLKKLETQNVRAQLDDRNESLNKKIREAELQKIPYLLVVGEREAKDKTVSVRERSKGDLGAMPLEKFFDLIKKL